MDKTLDRTSRKKFQTITRLNETPRKNPEADNNTNTKIPSQRHRPEQLLTDNMPTNNVETSHWNHYEKNFKRLEKQRTLSKRIRRSEARKTRSNGTTVDREDSILG